MRNPLTELNDENSLNASEGGSRSGGGGGGGICITDSEAVRQKKTIRKVCTENNELRRQADVLKSKCAAARKDVERSQAALKVQVAIKDVRFLLQPNPTR